MEKLQASVMIEDVALPMYYHSVPGKRLLPSKHPCACLAIRMESTHPRLSAQARSLQICRASAQKKSALRLKHASYQWSRSIYYHECDCALTPPLILCTVCHKVTAQGSEKLVVVVEHPWVLTRDTSVIANWMWPWSDVVFRHQKHQCPKTSVVRRNQFLDSVYHRHLEAKPDIKSELLICSSTTPPNLDCKQPQQHCMNLFVFSNIRQFLNYDFICNF